MLQIGTLVDPDSPIANAQSGSVQYNSVNSTKTYSNHYAPSSRRKEYSFSREGMPLSSGRQSILNRPQMQWTSSNATTIDQQYEQQKRNEEKRQNTYNKQANSHWNNYRHISDGKEQYDGGKIVDRGRGKGSARNIQGEYDPILRQWRAPPQPQASSSGNICARPRSAPRACSDEQYTRQKAVAWPNNLGSYNPILHSWSKQPTGEIARQQELCDRYYKGQYGLRNQTPPQGIWDPIRNNWVAPPAGKPSTPDYRTREFETKPRNRIYSAQNFGQMDPIQSQWAVPPQNPRHPNVVDRQGGKGRVPMPATQGVYNPVQNSWTVAPRDSRQVQGLTFAPQTTFTRYSYR